MAKGSKALAGIIVVFLIGAAFGLVMGLYVGLERGMSSVVDRVIHKDARDVQSQILTLKHLRAGETDQAIEVLEARMDDDLIMFDPAEPYPGISEGTYSEVAKALKQCKEYRAVNPRKSNRPHVDEMVKNVLKQGELN